MMFVVRILKFKNRKWRGEKRKYNGERSDLIICRDTCIEKKRFDKTKSSDMSCIGYILAPVGKITHYDKTSSDLLVLPSP